MKKSHLQFCFPPKLVIKYSMVPGSIVYRYRHFAKLVK